MGRKAEQRRTECLKMAYDCQDALSRLAAGEIDHDDAVKETLTLLKRLCYTLAREDWHRE
jgi:hypothetical protein